MGGLVIRGVATLTIKLAPFSSLLLTVQDQPKRIQDSVDIHTTVL